MVYLFLAKNHETVEALTVVDLLRRAEISITTVSISDELVVNSSLNIPVVCDKLFKDCDFSDVQALVLPGGAGVSNLLDFAPLTDLIKKEYDKKTLICAICAAPKILANIGINVKSTIYPTMTSEIANYCSDSVCCDGNVITGNALGASIDFSLEIIKYLKDIDTAKKVKEGIVYKN